ncbi:MAG: hypothetical protein OEW83_19465, partial [Acidimicrobiia bacterium]|nr:hypothetical protein [Acidimicrobiia bacterium]
MQFDPIRAILAASSDELGRLLEVVIPESRDSHPPEAPDREPSDVTTVGALTPGEREQWEDSGIMVDGSPDPTVVGLVSVLARPARSVVIERFCRNIVIPLFVAWGPHGRATLTDGIPGGDVTIQATSFDLLAPLLMQALHLHRGIEAGDRRKPIVTTAGALEALFDPDIRAAGGNGPDPADRSHDDLAAVMSNLR